MNKVIDRFSGEYRFLSNFYTFGPIEYNGIWFPTLEHAYQAAKTKDQTHQFIVCNAETPGKAKQLGKKYKARDDWKQIKLVIMENLLRQKFNYSEATKLLLDTGDAELIEGNNWNDTFWGVCNGVGENHLGRLLMMIREELRNEI